MADRAEFTKNEGRIINFLSNKIYIKMTEEKGRGVYAAKDLNEGTLILVEKSIAEYVGESDTGLSQMEKKSLEEIMHRDLVLQCEKWVKYKGLEALKLDYIYDGETPLNKLTMPPTDIYRSYKHQQYSLPSVSTARLHKIIKRSCHTSLH